MLTAWFELELSPQYVHEVHMFTKQPGRDFLSRIHILDEQYLVTNLVVDQLIHSPAGEEKAVSCRAQPF
jgi:hypothetical protein